MQIKSKSYYIMKIIVNKLKESNLLHNLA